MSRQLIALLIAVYAIAFAFGAMAAIRWPSLMLFATLMLDGPVLEDMPVINWRELGIAYGAPYFLAALCLYASALTVGKRRRGSVLWYLLGCAAGFPCLFLVDFEPGWWRDPGPWEGLIVGAGAGAVLLGLAVWLLRQGQIRRRPTPEPAAAATLSEADAHALLLAVQAAAPTAPKTKPRRRAVSPAIARQRAHMAAEGRKMLARRRARNGL